MPLPKAGGLPRSFSWIMDLWNRSGALSHSQNLPQTDSTCVNMRMKVWRNFPPLDVLLLVQKSVNIFVNIWYLLAFIDTTWIQAYTMMLEGLSLARCIETLLASVLRVRTYHMHKLLSCRAFNFVETCEHTFVRASRP